jgi:hypothetical protein
MCSQVHLVSGDPARHPAGLISSYAAVYFDLLSTTVQADRQLHSSLLDLLRTTVQKILVLSCAGRAGA